MLWAIDARTGEPREEHEVDQQPRALAASPDAIWIATGIKGKREGKILRLDRRSGSMETIDETSQPVNRLAVAGSQVLATLSYGVNNYAEDGRLVMGDGVFGELGGGGDGGGGGGGGDGGGGGGGGG
jgi:hypothetical protein